MGFDFKDWIPTLGETGLASCGYFFFRHTISSIGEELSKQYIPLVGDVLSIPIGEAMEGMFFGAVLLATILIARVTLRIALETCYSNKQDTTIMVPLMELETHSPRHDSSTPIIPSFISNFISKTSSEVIRLIVTTLVSLPPIILPSTAVLWSIWEVIHAMEQASDDDDIDDSILDEHYANLCNFRLGFHCIRVLQVFCFLVIRRYSLATTPPKNNNFDTGSATKLLSRMKQVNQLPGIFASIATKQASKLTRELNHRLAPANFRIC
jgi:hypothetical protein